MQQMSLITLGVRDIARARRFYEEGFGWQPAFQTPGIVFYQLNGFVFALWPTPDLEQDMQRSGLQTPGSFALAQNVSTKEDVQPLIDRLAQFGGRVLRNADEPPHGGFRGYVADPDDHAWEIAWNPSWPISPEGFVTFKM